MNPSKGEAGDPSIPPIKQHSILKRGPSPEAKPRFLRDTLSNIDINGAKPKKLFQGRVKDIISNHDIEGSSPSRLKVYPLITNRRGI